MGKNQNFVKVGNKIVNMDAVKFAERHDDNGVVVNIGKRGLCFHGQDAVKLWAHLTGQAVDVLSRKDG